MIISKVGEPNVWDGTRGRRRTRKAPPTPTSFKSMTYGFRSRAEKECNTLLNYTRSLVGPGPRHHASPFPFLICFLWYQSRFYRGVFCHANPSISGGL